MKAEKNKQSTAKQSKPMRITISGEAGSGKSTVADIIANKLKIKRHSTGDYMRTMAAARGVTIIELNKIGETDPTIDKELDDWQKKLEKKKDESFVLDSRLGYHFIPSSIKIFLEADIQVRAERIYNDQRLVEENTTLKKTIDNIKKRQQLERERYKEKYGIDYLDFTKYDLVLNTTKMSPEDVAERIIRFVDKR
ncbi:cytidylate kinase family protein [Candidatus Woesearchaeota archaeon]|nr:cytidylate kinase family protein [Candidatus Woesearchaeota archaeon]